MLTGPANTGFREDLTCSENFPKLATPEEGCLRQLKGGERGDFSIQCRIYEVRTTMMLPPWNASSGQLLQAAYISSHNSISRREQKSDLIQKTKNSPFPASDPVYQGNASFWEFSSICGDFPRSRPCCRALLDALYSRRGDK